MEAEAFHEFKPRCDDLASYLNDPWNGYTWKRVPLPHPIKFKLADHGMLLPATGFKAE